MTKIRYYHVTSKIFDEIADNLLKIDGYDWNKDRIIELIKSCEIVYDSEERENLTDGLWWLVNHPHVVELIEAVQRRDPELIEKVREKLKMIRSDLH